MENESVVGGKTIEGLHNRKSCGYKGDKVKGYSNDEQIIFYSWEKGRIMSTH